MSTPPYNFIELKNMKYENYKKYLEMKAVYDKWRENERELCKKEHKRDTTYSWISKNYQKYKKGCALRNRKHKNLIGQRNLFKNLILIDLENIKHKSISVVERFDGEVEIEW